MPLNYLVINCVEDQGNIDFVKDCVGDANNLVNDQVAWGAFV